MFSRRTLLEAASAIALSNALGAQAQNEGAEYTVLELRQYTLRGRQRDTLISMFEKSFLEPQNALGAHVIGTFRDLDDADRFVWIRGFRDMSAREQALTAFYGGPIWRANRTAANATMLDSDNVLLLQPSAPGQGFTGKPTAGPLPHGIIGAMIYYLGEVNSKLFAQFFEETIVPQLAAAGVAPLARLVTEESPNNFPRLPVREHERTFVCFARWRDAAAEDAFVAGLRALSGWRDTAPEAVLPALMRKPERLRLAPTARSELR
jgi:NIPSNAP